MAKGKSRSVSRTDQRARDFSTIAPQGRSFMPALPAVEDFQFLPGADRRRYHPERKLFRPLVAQAGEARLYRPFFDPRLTVLNPRKVLLCARRKERREVLFAKRSLGRGGEGRRNHLSKLQCRRK